MFVDAKKEIANLSESSLEMGSTVTVVSSANFPEGGLAAWRTVIGAWLACFLSFGFTNSWGVIQAQLERDTLSDQEPSTIAWIGSVAIGIMCLLSFPAGVLFDKGHGKALVGVGSVMTALGAFMLSLSTKFYQCFLSYGICLGIGVGLIYGPALSAVGTYFYKRRAFIVAFSSTGAAVGGVIFPIFLNRLFAQIGFAKTVRYAGCIQLFCAFFTFVAIQPRKLALNERPPTVQLLKKMTGEPETWTVYTGGAFMMCGLFIPLFFYQVFVEEHVQSLLLNEYGMSLMNATSFFGRLMIGVIADRIGILNAAIPIVTVTCIMCFILESCTTFAAALAFILIYGAALGAWQAIMTPVYMTLAGTKVNEIGSRVGLAYTYSTPFMIAGSPIAGVLRSKTHGYLAPCLFGGSVIFLSLCLFLVSRVLIGRQRPTWKL